MIEHDREDGGPTLTLTFEDRLNGEDYRRLASRIEAIAARWGAARLLIRAKGPDGVGPETWWREFKLGLGRLDDIERMAIVAHADWRDRAAGDDSPLNRPWIRVFTDTEADLARRWIAC